MEVNKKYCKMMVDEMNTIKTEAIRDFGLKCLGSVPAYFFTVPASSSGRYHPVNDLGEGGLVRHSISVKRMLDHLLTPEGYYAFTDEEKDLLRLAALLHDCMKSGSSADYEKNPQTKFLHPVYAAKFIDQMASHTGFDGVQAEFIHNAIISHMGQWNVNKRTSETLPKPETPAQKILHMADYLASRKDINMTFRTDETVCADTPLEKMRRKVKNLFKKKGDQ